MRVWFLHLLESQLLMHKVIVRVSFWLFLMSVNLASLPSLKSKGKQGRLEQVRGSEEGLRGRLPAYLGHPLRQVGRPGACTYDAWTGEGGGGTPKVDAVRKSQGRLHEDAVAEICSCRQGEGVKNLKNLQTSYLHGLLLLEPRCPE